VPIQGGSARHQPWGLGGVAGRVAEEFGECLGVFMLLWLLALMGGETVRFRVSATVRRLARSVQPDKYGR
jgi:hypothetical protein